MALAKYNGVAYVVTSGNFVLVAPSASVEVRREDTGALATLFSDRDGTVGLSNPTTADVYGRFSFHVAGITSGYRIRVTEAASPGLEHTLRYVPVGLFAELDNPLTTLGDIMVALASGVPTRKAVGTDGYPLVPVTGATGALAYMPPALGYNLVGGYLDWSVVGSPTSILSVAVKTWLGNDPSASEPVWIPFRSATAATGTITYRKITAATSIAINSSALLGTVGGVAFRLWCVAFDDGGTIRLALINCLTTSAGPGSGRNADQIYPLAGWGIASATQESDTSDSAQTFYSDGAAVASKAYTVLGWGSWEAGLPNAGNWNSAPTRIQLFGPGMPLPGAILQELHSFDGAVATTTTAIPFDDSIPQITEGGQFMTLSITPSSAPNVLDIDHAGLYSHSGNDSITAALFQDATANALAAQTEQNNGAGLPVVLEVRHRMLAATTSSTAFKLRAGGQTGSTVTFNGVGGARKLGGVSSSRLHVRELMA